MSDLSRRSFLGASTLSLLGSEAPAQVTALPDNNPQSDTPGAREASKKPLRLAAINSIYRLRSHAYHIVGRYIHGMPLNGFHHTPRVQVVRMYNHQSPKDDLTTHHAKLYGIEHSPSVEAALGGDQLDVDGVLLIIEHGDYPVNPRGQILYPRYELFQEIVDVFRKQERSVPVFVDKHLSYDHEKAHAMVQTARGIGFPLMAGSSLPVTWRIPELEPPLETPFQEGVVTFGYDRGPAEIYLFHALETLQVFLERRKGGETGVKKVTGISGNAVWEAADRGVFDWELVRASLSRSPSVNIGPIRKNVLNPFAIVIEYNDGTKGTVLNFAEQTSDLCFAGRESGKIHSTCCYLPPPPGARFFDPLSYHIEQFMLDRKAPYPVERTLLTSTILDLALRSNEDKAPRTDSTLQVQYTPPKSSGFFRGPVIPNSAEIV